MRAFHAGVLPWRAACYAAAYNAASAKRGDRRAERIPAAAAR